MERDDLKRAALPAPIVPISGIVTSPSAIELRALIGAYPTLLTGIYRWSDGRWLFEVQRGQ